MLLYVNHHPSDHLARATEQQAAQETASSWPSCMRRQLLYLYMCFGGVWSARCQLLLVSSRDLLLGTTGYWLFVTWRLDAVDGTTLDTFVDAQSAGTCRRLFFELGASLEPVRT